MPLVVAEDEVVVLDFTFEVTNLAGSAQAGAARGWNIDTRRVERIGQVLIRAQMNDLTGAGDSHVASVG